MNDFLQNTTIKKAAAILLFSAILFVGFELRSSRLPHFISGDTVKSYYFAKSEQLITEGRFPAVDRWSFSPAMPQENAPPLLAYASLFTYRALDAVFPMSFEEFANLFPPLVFGLWSVFLFIVFSRLFSVPTAVVSGALLVFMPASVELTSFGSYFQETIGAPLLFACVYAVLRVVDATTYNRTRRLLFGIVALTALVLAWQQFPFFYAFLFGILALFWIRAHWQKCWCRDHRRVFWSLVIILVASLFVGELVSRVMIGTGYSPLEMLGEFFYGFVYRNDSELLFAMSRTDWKNPGFMDFYHYYGLAGIVFCIFGFTAAFFNKIRRNRFITLFGIGALLVFSMFSKDRFFALAILLYVFALGAEAIYMPQVLVRTAGRTLKKMISVLTRKNIAKTCLFASLIMAVLFALRVMRKDPVPEIAVMAPEQRAVGVPQEIRITLKNRGGRQEKYSDAFSGLHIEVQNALVYAIDPFASGTQAKRVIKNFSRAGKIFFFETTYQYLGAGNTGEARFMVVPYTKDFFILYRGWIPGRCASSRDEQGDYWRGESCIRRIPAAGDSEAVSCLTPVLAGKGSLQDFFCFKL